MNNPHHRIKPIGIPTIKPLPSCIRSVLVVLSESVVSCSMRNNHALSALGQVEFWANSIRLVGDATLDYAHRQTLAPKMGRLIGRGRITLRTLDQTVGAPVRAAV